MALRRGPLLLCIAAGLGSVLLAAAALTLVVGWTVGRADTTMTVAASREDGAAPSDEELERLRGALLTRLEAAGLRSSSVRREVGARLVVRVGGRPPAALLRGLTAPGQLRFRRVTASLPVQGPAPERIAGRAVVTNAPPTLAQVAARLGPAYELASTLTEPADPGLSERLAPFGTLSPDEVAALPPQMQYMVPTITCEQLRARPRVAASDPERPMVACGSDARYLLDAATVTGKDLASAKAGVGPDGGWTVTVSFTGDGQSRWTALTRELFAEQAQVAIVLDTVVISAPVITAVITGDAQIAGAFTRADAQSLAAQLAGGELGLRLEVLRGA